MTNKLFKKMHQHGEYTDYRAELLATPNDEVVIEATLTLVEGGKPYLSFSVGDKFVAEGIDGEHTLTDAQAQTLLALPDRE